MTTCSHCSLEIPVTNAFCPRCGTPNPDAATLPISTVGGEIAEPAAAADLRPRLRAALGHDFVVGDELGEGGFAVVFAVEDLKLSRKIAVKVLRPELTSSRSAVQRFVREAKAAAGLSHPHILPIFFVGEGEGLVYFGMPLVEGETLEALLAREKRLPEPEVARIGAEIAEALAEAHAHGLVHRDVKPANVLLQGAARRALVADFGIAKAAAGGGDKLTGTGVIIGSPHYMSPEQAAGSGSVDPRTDVYSLGVVLWQMLAGAPPFEGADSQDVLVQHLTKPLPRLADRRRDVSPNLARIVARCCEKHAERRFQTSAELAAALRSPTASGARPRAAGRRPRPALLVALAVAIVLGGAALLTSLGRSPTTLPPTTSEAPAAPARPTGPVLAVLPFDVSISGDTAQWSRQAARSLASTIADRFGVATVDFNDLLGRWNAQRRKLADPLDSNAAFAYRMAANQLVMGSIVEAGRQARVAADVYDTRTVTKIGHSERDGSPDSLITMLDRLAGQVAEAFCRQPDFNPRNLCYDVAAKPKVPVAVAWEGARSLADSQPLFFVLVSAAGQVSDLRPKGDLPPTLITAAFQALRSSAYTPAKKGASRVDAWTTVPVVVRQPAGGVASVAASCANVLTSMRNPGSACYDSRPTAMTPPVVTVPASCRGAVSALRLSVRVSATGDVIGRPVMMDKTCPAFAQAAVAAAADFRFMPAKKGGHPVEAWVQIVIHPTQ